MPWSKDKPKPKRYLLSCGRDKGREAILESLEKLGVRSGLSVQEMIWDALFEYVETNSASEWSKEL